MKKIKESTEKNEKLEWVKSIIIAILLTLFLFNFVVFTANVPTSSMEPTIMSHERIIVWKCLRYLDWENRGLTYGDIVVFNFQDSKVIEEKKLVKRVIGLGGDTIYIENGIVFRNGIALEEPYVINKDSFFMNEIVVPENEVFVLGDNRRDSYDGRYWEKQTFSLDNVIGEVKLFK